MKRQSTPAFTLTYSVCMLTLSTGCASYRVGAKSLYAPDIATVYVPMIESDSFRPDLGERLTEAVVKEIELKTPFKVVGTPDADSILSTRLVSDTKRVTIENRNDDPRALEFKMAAQVTWLNRRRIPLQAPSTLELPPELLPIGQTSTRAISRHGSTAGHRAFSSTDCFDHGRTVVSSLSWFPTIKLATNAFPAVQRAGNCELGV